MLPRTLLGWVHSGFAVHGARVVWRDDSSSVERLARYALRAPVPFDAVELKGSKVRVKTPQDPRTGSWARLLRRILEVNPLLCARCGVEMKIVSVITEPKVVDAIL